MYLLLKAL